MGQNKWLSHSKKIVVALFALLLLYILAKQALRGTGLGAVNVRDVMLFSLLIIILNSSRKAFWLIAFPFVVAYALYLPIGINFGPPSFKYFASVLATDASETKEFFQQIPTKYLLYPLGIIAGLVGFRYLSVKFDLRFSDNKTLLIIMAIFALLPQSPFHYPRAVYHSLTKLNDEMKKLKEIVSRNDWLIKSSQPKYRNYILIIGESARRDYHHAYGYPIENTPFMSKSVGVLVDGLTAGGTNTVASLRLMLSKPDTDQWEVQYPYNFVDMAKKAGVHVTWISNQGFFGKFDTPVTSIASKSDRKRFIKMGEYNSINTDDLLLLPRLKEELENYKVADSRLIVLHMYGSHPAVCDRLHGFEPTVEVNDETYKHIACYVSSIRKTDAFLEEVHAILNERLEDSGETFSLLYFADHGLAHRKLDGVMRINNNFAVKQHYEIPLFKVSSDDTERTVIKRQKSGLRFTEGLATWMGIESPLLPEKYDLFSDEDDETDFGLSKKLEKLPDDPAIDIRGL